MTLTVNEYLFLPPDRADSIQYTRAWKTNIQKTVVSGETRSALYTWARRSLNFTITPNTVAENNYLKRKLYKNLHNVWGIPYWGEYTPLTSQAASGQNIIAVEEVSYRNFEVGGLCVLLKSIDEFEVGEIQSITDDNITLVDNLTLTWDAITAVYPILKARLKVDQSVSHDTSILSTYSFQADEAVDVDKTPNILTSSIFPLYWKKPVFNREPDWINQVNMSFNHNYDLLQYLGEQYSSSLVDETTIKTNASFLEISLPDMNEILSFFDENKGRYGAFWIPSFTNDIQITSPFSSTETTFDIEDIDWSNYWGENAVIGKHIRFLFPNGTEAYKKIIDSPTNQLTIGEAIGKEVSSSELPFMQVSFLFFVRFDSDEITINQITNTIADFNLNFSSVLDSVSTTTTTTTTTTTSTTSSTASSTSTTSSTVPGASTTTTSTTTTTTIVPPSGYTAKSVILDIADNWGNATYLHIRSIDFWFEGSKIIVTSGFTAYVTSFISASYAASNAFNTSLSKTGSWLGTSWVTNTATTNQRLIIVFDTEIEFDSIVINNGHNSGGSTDGGSQNVKINITPDIITDTTYDAAISNATLIYNSTFDQHINSNIEDSQTLILI